VARAFGVVVSTVRTFVAVDISERSREALSDLVESIRRKGDGLSWSNPNTYHVTLRFLGDIEGSKLDDVATAVHDASADLSGFSIRFGTTGAFPNLRRPRVLFVGIDEGTDELVSLAASLNAELDRRGFGSEKSFSPHLTVARVRRETPDARVLDRWRTTEFEAPHTRVEEIIVFESQLRSDGARHIPRARIALTGR
jgi:2'-5' RNA ligase